jgi:hypothetical protein
LPAGHSSQENDPVDEANLPSWHVVQAGAASWLEKEPLGQTEHTDEAAPLYVPFKQSSQMLFPKPCDIFPASHDVQLTWFPIEKKPGLQLVQAIVPS